mmetsp:Transcript_4764/g.7361  ORF Transcript_4764/g.7361 Transcript_4764/m.7361 type:complete len:105 (+) Transcript_4764:971-1285(+)
MSTTSIVEYPRGQIFGLKYLPYCILSSFASEGKSQEDLMARLSFSTTTNFFAKQCTSLKGLGDKIEERAEKTKLKCAQSLAWPLLRSKQIFYAEAAKIQASVLT